MLSPHPFGVGVSDPSKTSEISLSCIFLRHTPAFRGWLVEYEQGVEARSGHGSPAGWSIGESDEADPSEVLPRRGKTSVPAKTPQVRTREKRAWWDKIKKCRERESNPPRRPFQGRALPLSYLGILFRVKTVFIY